MKVGHKNNCIVPRAKSEISAWSYFLAPNCIYILLNILYPGIISFKEYN